MNVHEAIMNRRTIRKFTSEKVDKEKLLKLVDCGRMAATGANMQPLKFAIIDKEKMTADVFPYTSWAGYLKDGAPKENERPTAYIAILGDTDIKANGAFDTDAGSSVATMMLMAEELGLATCWLGALNREKIHEAMGLSDNLKLLFLLAVGYKNQESRAVDAVESIKYFLDENDVLNVPKRSIDEVLVDL